MRGNRERQWLPGFFPLDFCNFAVNCTFPPTKPSITHNGTFLSFGCWCWWWVADAGCFFCLMAYRPFKTCEREIMRVWDKVHVVSEHLVLHQTKKTSIEEWLFGNFTVKNSYMTSSFPVKPPLEAFSSLKRATSALQKDLNSNSNLTVVTKPYNSFTITVI